MGALADDEAALEHEVRDLALRATYYRCFIEPSSESDAEMRRSLEHLLRWGAQTTHPLLMHLYGLRGEGRATTEQLRRCLSFIESFLVRRQLVGVPTNQLNRLFADAVRQLNPDVPVDEALRELLSRERRYWPTDDQIREAVRTRNFYFAGRAAQRMVILERLEESFDHREPVDMQAARPTIEHIMPQTLTEEWRLHLAEHGDDPQEMPTRLMHTLGNLTLSAYNTELSNKVFERKQQMYATSHFELNKALTETPNWTSMEILARADELARRVILVWPGPLSSGEGAPETIEWGRVDAGIALIPSDRTCAVTELAQLVPTTPDALIAHLRSRPTHRGFARVLDDRGLPLASVSDVAGQAGHRPITAYELAQLMPFEFDNEELRALRRTRGPVTMRRGSTIDAETLVPFLRVAEGLHVSTLLTLRQRLRDMQGTPQNPTDWSDPDRWIPERLTGDEADAARDIWERSNKYVNPRYLHRRMAALDRLHLAAVVNGDYVLTDRGRAVLAGELSLLQSSTDTSDGRSRADIFAEFWQAFQARAEVTGSRFAGLQAQRSDWIQRSAGVSGVRYIASVHPYHMHVELSIDSGDARDANRQIFEGLREHQTEIESAFGGVLEWIVKPDQRAMQVACELETGGYIDGDPLSDLAEELFEAISRFEAALQPFIDDLTPERAAGSGWQPRDRPWTEEEYLSAVRALAPENAGSAAAILAWAHNDHRVAVQGGWGAQNAGIRIRTTRPNDPGSEHSFINLYANSADNASAEVQFASMARRDPFVDPGNRLQLLNELSAISTSTWVEGDINMRVPFRLRDLRDPDHLKTFLTIFSRYLDEFHSVESAYGHDDVVGEGLSASGPDGK